MNIFQFLNLIVWVVTAGTLAYAFYDMGNRRNRTFNIPELLILGGFGVWLALLGLYESAATLITLFTR